LEEARLFQGQLEGADLFGAHLEGAELTNAHLQGADLRFNFFDQATILDDILLANEREGAVLLGDIRWNGVNLGLSVRFGEARLLVQESDGRAIQTVRSTVSAKKPKILSSLRKKALCCAQTLYWKRERAAPASLARSSA